MTRRVVYVVQLVEENFWGNLKIIQEEIVCSYSSQLEKGISLDLYEITFDTIYSILELIDGYRGNSLGISLVDKESGQVINQDRFLHDRCEKYLCNRSINTT